MSGPVRLDGESLSIDQVVAVSRADAPVSVAESAVEELTGSRAAITDAIAAGRVIYGINTGFGKLADVKIPDEQVVDLQRNLIRSHCAGVGTPLPVDVVRALMVLRANVLLKPTSGARPVLAEKLVEMLNNGIHPVVPEQGSVGASGDLAPLSHVALALMGEGEVLVHMPGNRESQRLPALEAMNAAGIEAVEFQAKEGLSFINGTQAQTAMLALLVHDSRNLWRSSIAATAASLEALRGTPVAFDSRIHETRPHTGQRRAAALLRELLADSEIRESHRENDPRVQDAYSLRCAPQVLGAVSDAIGFCARVAEVELNSATDNPLAFGDEILSGGNFHGQPVAQALDFLAIALTTLSGISERRIERLVNPDLSQGLPAFLTDNAGLQSGFMMVQITAAGLVAESRALATPASVQSIPTDANQEDFVPMGMASAFKTRRILQNAARVVAAELISAAQGLEYLKPLQPGSGVRDVYARVRELVQAYEKDRPHTPDIERVARLLLAEAIV